MAAAEARGAARAAPHPNPNGDGPRLRSPPGKGKPFALADITNTGKPNPTRSVSISDVVKENAKLLHLLNEKTKIIELSRVEMHKLRLVLQSSRQQNLLLTQSNSQMLAELNLGKDKIKVLQHEVSCTEALLKVKNSELERKNKIANQRRKEINSQEIMKAMPSKVAAVEFDRIDGLVARGVEYNLVESQSADLSNTGCHEPPDTATKRGRNKRKSESNECIKDTNIMQDHNRPHLQPIVSVDHEDLRKPLRRRSARLNSGSCETTEVSCTTLHEEAGVPLAPSSLTVPNQHGPDTGKDMENSLQNERSKIVDVLIASKFEKVEISEQPQNEPNLTETEEAFSRVSGVEADQIGDKDRNTEQNQLAEIQSSLPTNTTEAPEPPEDTCHKRDANKQKLKLNESGKDSVKEDINDKCGSSTSEPLRQKEKRKSQRRKSSRMDSVLSDGMKSKFVTLDEDVIAPLPPSCSNASVEQRISQKQADCCPSTKSAEGQVSGRRSLRRAAEKVLSYKEPPLNVKMRRP